MPARIVSYGLPKLSSSLAALSGMAITLAISSKTIGMATQAEAQRHLTGKGQSTAPNFALGSPERSGGGI